MFLIFLPPRHPGQLSDAFPGPPRFGGAAAWDAPA